MMGFTDFTARLDTQENFVKARVAEGYDAAQAAAFWNATHTYQTINGQKRALLPLAPYPTLVSGNLSAPLPPQFETRFSFDTIGQVIVRSIGHCRLPLRIIWAQGINESGDVSISNTQSFAGALCAPIDATEEIDIVSIWDGGSLILNADGVLTPPGWSVADAALLAASMAGILVYPGDEAQLPDPSIVADKGVTRTNAFRGIRYIIIPNYPVRSGGVPTLSIGVNRTNAEPTDDLAVDFLGGSD